MAATEQERAANTVLAKKITANTGTEIITFLSIICVYYTMVQVPHYYLNFTPPFTFTPPLIIVPEGKGQPDTKVQALLPLSVEL